MTNIIVDDIRPRVQYEQQNAENRVFSIPFPALSPEDILVAVDYEPLDPSAYVVAIEETENRTVTLNTAPAEGARISIWRDMAFERTTDFAPGADLRAAVLNDELDRTALLLQQAEALVGDSIHRAPYDLDQELLLPPATDRANRLLGFDADGAVQISSLSAEQIEAGSVTAAASATAAQAAQAAAEVAQSAAAGSSAAAATSASAAQSSADAAAASAVDAATAAASVGDPLPRDGSAPMTGALSGTRVKMTSASGEAGSYGRNVLTSSTALSTFASLAGAGDDSLLELRAPDTGSPAMQGFHVPGTAGALAGVDTDARFRIGGWSFPADAFNMDTIGRAAFGTDTASLGNYQLTLDARGVAAGLTIATPTNTESFMFSDQSQATLRGMPRSGGRYQVVTDGTQKLALGGVWDAPAMEFDPAAAKISVGSGWTLDGVTGYERLVDNVTANVSNFDVTWPADNWAAIVIPFAVHPYQNYTILSAQLFQNGNPSPDTGAYAWNYIRNTSGYTGAMGSATIRLSDATLKDSFWQTGQIVIPMTSQSWGNQRGGFWNLSGLNYDNSTMNLTQGGFIYNTTACVTGIRFSVNLATAYFAASVFGLRDR